ncbi:MAG: 6-phosphofructokinase [Bacteroidales bacterium]|nr:6-phosphofructokinase [Bacteroidales bacterium]
MSTLNIGILTSGGDTPGINAAIRGIGKTALSFPGVQLIGFKDGFRGIMENRTVEFDNKMLSGILTLGGTILGTSREKPYKMIVAGHERDMTDVIVENYHRNHLDVLVCIGGNGTQKNAFHLAKAGLNIITLPKTIDNDIVHTDTTFGFDTALGIATEAIDRLHSTASSHHRIILVEIMGHKAGWLALGAGIAGGADVILIPEIPYSIKTIAESILERKKQGKSFSIIAVAEGAMSKEFARVYNQLSEKIEKEEDKDKKSRLKAERKDMEKIHATNTIRLANQLQEHTGIDTRVTILGHLQRGGTPSAYDRLLATKLGTACFDFIQKKEFGKMVAVQNNDIVAIPLEKVVKKIKNVPLDHPWIKSARSVGTCLGD